MDWVRGERVGHGSFGKVDFAIPTSQQSSPWMVAKSCAASCSATLVNEKTILDHLKGCPQIISCLGDSYTSENGVKLYNILLEYASGGALSDKLKNSVNQKLPEFDVKKYTKALLKGLDFIHKTGYVHCDIKLENILLGEDGQVKIADFGLAKSERGNDWRCELRGTPLYMSPEMVTRGEQGRAADIWALGCVVAEMVTGTPVWRCLDITQLLMTIGIGDELPGIPEKLCEGGQDFLRKCFVKDPVKRWTAEMLLKHPFVTDVDEICEGDTSPRCPFDFPDWDSSETCSITSPAFQELTTPSQRLLGLAAVECIPESDWSFDDDDWITVR